MRKIVLAATLAALFPITALNAAGDHVELPKQKWSFQGAFGKFDKQQLQRGFQVYKEVCSACHSLQYIAFRNLADLGYSEAQIKAIAGEYQVDDGPDDAGDMFKRKAKASDHIPKPYPNDQAARAGNGGALPPDLSLMAKARVGGPDYIYNLMLGYSDAPAGFGELSPGMSYNKYFTAGGHQIAMPKQLEDGKVTYADGTATSADQLARDVSAFLMWTAEPKLEARHSTGFRVLVFTFIFTVLAYFLKRRIWARIGH